MPDIDPRPYWQRQRRTVAGWAAHRRSVQEWKKRNPSHANAHTAAHKVRQKLRYGDRTSEKDVAWIKRASEWNELYA